MGSSCYTTRPNRNPLPEPRRYAEPGSPPRAGSRSVPPLPLLRHVGGRHRCRHRAQSLPCWQSPPSPPLQGAPDASPLACRRRPARHRKWDQGACLRAPALARRQAPRRVRTGRDGSSQFESPTWRQPPPSSPGAPLLPSLGLAAAAAADRRRRRQFSDSYDGSRPLLDPAAYGSSWVSLTRAAPSG